MKRYWIALIGIALVGLLVGSYLIYDRSANADPYSGFISWPPGPAAIHQAVAAAQPSKPGGDAEEARHQAFAQLFQNRFRNHSPAIAVGLHFSNDHVIRLLCPARMEPWRIDLLASSAWREVQDDFGHPCVVDIYETFIGIKPIKIGELRPMPDHPQTAHITYTGARL